MWCKGEDEEEEEQLDLQNPSKPTTYFAIKLKLTNTSSPTLLIPQALLLLVVFPPPDSRLEYHPASHFVQTISDLHQKKKTLIYLMNVKRNESVERCGWFLTKRKKGFGGETEINRKLCAGLLYTNCRWELLKWEGYNKRLLHFLKVLGYKWDRW